MAAGLFHANCRHSVGIYIEGVTEAPRSTEDPRGYEERQEQRHLERQVRKWKRRAAVGDPGAPARVRLWQARLREFVDEHDRKRLSYREQVGGGRRERLPRKTPRKRPGKPEPAGTPVSDAIENGVRRADEEILIDALKAIDEVHGDGPLPKVPLLTNNRMNALGQYRHRLRERTPVDIRIKFPPSAPHPRLTIAHEIGHFLDHQGIGDPGLFETTKLPPGLLAKWWDAVEKSKAVEGLNAMFHGATLPDGRRPNWRLLMYLLQPQEIWARAYAQYVATRCVDEDMKADLRDWLDNHNAYGEQWTEDDFEPIAKAFDALFEELGWRKKPSR